MNKTTNCVVAGCTIRNVGDYNGSGVNITGGLHNGVVGCDISHTGGDGIIMSGGDQKTLTAAENYADNNCIHHTGIYYKQGVGIELKGVGNRASHNLIHDTPRMGILFWGNNHLIEYNHVHHANLETQDSGIIYTSGRDWLGGRGCVVRDNFFHDSGGYGQNTTNGAWEFFHNTVGIYLDDNAGGVDIIGNIVVRCSANLINLNNARDNWIENNILEDGGNEQICYTGWTSGSSNWVNFLPEMVKGYELVRNEPSWRAMRNMGLHPTNAVLSDGTIMSGNVFCRNIVRYTSPSARLWTFSHVALDHQVCDSNLVWHSTEARVEIKNSQTQDKTLAEAAWRRQGLDFHSLFVNGTIEEAGNKKKRLAVDVAVLKLGFNPIPVQQIGPESPILSKSFFPHAGEGFTSLDTFLQTLN